MTTTLHNIKDERLAGGLAMLLVIVATAFANFAGSGENGGPGPYAVGLVVCAIAAGLLFGRVLPESGNLATAAWILAGLAVLSGIVVWSGLPFVFAMGAIHSAIRAERTVPLAIGALAIVAAFVGCVVG